MANSPTIPEAGIVPDARKLRVAIARSAGKSKLVVSEEESVDPTTIYDWERNDEQYRGYLRDAMGEIKSEALAEAINVLRMALRPADPAGNPIPMHTRLRAAAIIVQSADRHDSMTANVNVEHGGVVTVVSRVEVPERKRNG